MSSEQVEALFAGAAGVPAGMVAVAAAGLADPSGGREDSAVLAVQLAGAGTATPGTVMTFAQPVVTLPVKIRRSGAVQADGWLPGQVRLGSLEPFAGEGVIEALCDEAVAAGLVTAPERRRLMSLPFIMRAVIAMTLLPGSDYAEVIRVVAGLLPAVPWRKRWRIPTHKTITAWRRRLGTWPLERLFWRVAGPLVDDDAPGAVMLAGRPLCAMDGFELDLPASAGNRAVFSCSGAGPGEDASFPHLRCVLLTARAGRAILGAVTDATGAGEQSLVWRLVKDRPGLFAGRVFLMDRNFPGHELITAILDAGGHLVMRVKAGISLPVTDGGWLADGSRVTYLNEPRHHRVAGRLPLRVVEHNAELPGTSEPGDGQVSETYTIATTLMDHELAPAEALRAAYPMRWPASETTIGENKSTLTGAGPATTPCLRSKSPDLVRQELWAWLTATQLVRASAVSATRTGTAAAITARRGHPGEPAGTDQVSFTTMRRNAIGAMNRSLVTATTSPAALTALAQAASEAALHSLTVTGRQRYAPRKQKSRPGFPHAPATKTTHKGPVKITLFQPGPGPG
jgi:hypothetical protein